MSRKGGVKRCPVDIEVRGREEDSASSRTDTILRTQTITKPQKYLPPFYRFSTISFVSFVSFVTLAFSIHLLLRYKRPLKRPSKSPLKGDFGFPPFKGGAGRVFRRGLRGREGLSLMRHKQYGFGTFVPNPYRFCEEQTIILHLRLPLSPPAPHEPLAGLRTPRGCTPVYA